MSEAAPKGKSVVLENSRQQLEELDALLRRMMALPVNRLNFDDGPANDPGMEADPQTGSETDLGASIGFADDLHPDYGPDDLPGDSIFTFSSEAPAYVTEIPDFEQILTSKAGPFVWDKEQPHRMPSSTSAGNGDEAASGDVQSAAVVGQTAVVHASSLVEVQTTTGEELEGLSSPVAGFEGGPLIRLLNDSFDAVVGRCGPPGRWLIGPEGRFLLGIVGTLLIVVGAGLVVADRLGWTR